VDIAAPNVGKTIQRGLASGIFLRTSQAEIEPVHAVHAFLWGQETKKIPHAWGMNIPKKHQVR